MTVFNDEKIIKLAARFKEHGKELYMVGGVVRDMIMGKQPRDYDFVTDATTDEIQKMFEYTIPTGIQHGTITVIFDGEHFEITTYRVDGIYTDGRHPDNVFFDTDIKKDLSRRDFTMNAIAFDPLRKTYDDPLVGVTDIYNKVIRCVGRAKERFLEDGLRILRAVRFMAQFGFTLDRRIRESFEDSVIINALDKISPERIRDELSKILTTRQSFNALLVMEEYGILDKIIPEFLLCKGQRQNEYHSHDVLKHILITAGKAGKAGASLHVCLAALLHDIGKPQTASLKDDGINYSFLGHEEKSAEIAKTVLKRLKYPNDIQDKVVHLVRIHMEPLHYNKQWKKSTIRRFIVRVGVENLDDLFILNAADLYASGTHTYTMLNELKERVYEVLNEKPILSTNSLAINGHDLLGIGFEQGSELGKMLKYLLDVVLERPEFNTREQLLELARPGTPLFNGADAVLGSAAQGALTRFYRASPVLTGGDRYYVPTAYGTKEKAIAEAEKWIARNKAAGEVWTIEIRRNKNER
jgi:putative nucleotidyltransferase with HDIG domain